MSDITVLPDVAFTEPWQSRVFAAAVLTTERLGLPWDAFRDQLKQAVAEDGERPYYESFTLALERLANVGPGGVTEVSSAGTAGDV